MANLQYPKTSIIIKAGKSSVVLDYHRVLIIGNSNNVDSVPKLISEISLVKAIKEYGKHSILTLAIENFKKYNKVTNLDSIGLQLTDKNNSSVSTAKIFLNGTVDRDGYLTLSILDDIFSFNIKVTKGTDANDLYDLIINKINTEDLPFEFEKGTHEDTNVLLINSKNKGIFLNNNRVSITSNLPLLETEVISNFQGGTGEYTDFEFNEDFTNRYHTIIFDSNQSREKVIELLESRFNKENEILSGSCFEMISDSMSKLKNTIKLLNYKTYTVFSNLDEMPFVANPLIFISEFAAKRALRLTPGEDVSHINLNPREATGGIDKASLPYFNIEMSYKSSPKEISLDKAKLLEKNGISLLINKKANNKTQLSKVFTTYKFDAAGQKSNIWSALNSIDTAIMIQEYFFNSFKKEYPQHRIASKTIGTTSTIDIYMIETKAKQIYNELMYLALVDGSDEGIEKFNNSLEVILDRSKGFFNIYAEICLMNQLNGFKAILVLNYELK